MLLNGAPDPRVVAEVLPEVVVVVSERANCSFSFGLLFQQQQLALVHWDREELVFEATK